MPVTCIVHQPVAISWDSDFDPSLLGYKFPANVLASHIELTLISTQPEWPLYALYHDRQDFATQFLLLDRYPDQFY